MEETKYRYVDALWLGLYMLGVALRLVAWLIGRILRLAIWVPALLISAIMSDAQSDYD